MEWKYVLVIAFGFLMGSILFSYHLPVWLRGIDVTALSADHNPGTANAVRHAGAPIGMMCLMADMFKGFLPVRIGMECLNMENLLFALVMAAPVFGHAIAPFYRRIPGGKAIAVSFGVLMALRPVTDAVWILASLYIFFSMIVVIRPNERRTVWTFAVFIVWMLIVQLKKQAAIAMGCIVMSAVVMWKNRKAPAAG